MLASFIMKHSDMLIYDLLRGAHLLLLLHYRTLLITGSTYHPKHSSVLLLFCGACQIFLSWVMDLLLLDH